jgi:hypothetical protein
MWLVNEATGDKILLAKYTCGEGWRVATDKLSEALKSKLHAATLDSTPYGRTDWRTEYDT